MMATSTVSADQFEVRGKVALVTGAASGIGLAITKCLLENGAKVSILDINGTEGERVLASLRDQYSADVVSFMQVDVTDAKQLANSFQKTKEMFGGLDIVCNNAGIVDGEENWRLLIEVNVCAVIEGTTLAIEHMSTTKGGKGGVVINTSSTAGIVPFVVMYSKYTASKHAIVGFTRVQEPTARTHGVRVNCICPGGVDTPPLRDMLNRDPPMYEPEVVEYAKTHLLSPEKVAEGVLKLIKDTTKAGAVMAITYESGFTFPKLLDTSDLFPVDIVNLLQEKEAAD